MTLLAPEGVYLLCLATSALCALLLVRAYLRTRTGLLLGAAIGFSFLCLNNLLLVIDLVVFPTSIDLSLWRQAAGFAAIASLLYTFSGEPR